ncbi:ATP-binding protein [Streptomyces sp. NBC_00708]
MTSHVRLALFGASGAGKSTTCGLLLQALERTQISVKVEKLAEPLYEVQRHVYALCGKAMADPYEQDGVLLASLADNFRRIDPNSLTSHFAARVVQAEQQGIQVVICDDMRKPDAATLTALGFRTVRISAPDQLRIARRAGRGDLSEVSDSHNAEQEVLIEPDIDIRNDGALTQLAQQVESVVALIHDRLGLVHAQGPGSEQ